MGCTYFSGPGFVGHICHGDHWLSLEPFGAKVWCDDHNWLGPTFYRSEAALKVIEKPSQKTWAAYCKWRETLRPNATSHRGAACGASGGLPGYTAGGNNGETNAGPDADNA